MLVTVGAAAAANLVQTGFLWNPGTIIPNLGRLNPASRIGRMFSFRSSIEFGASVIKLMILIGVLVIFVRTRLSTAGPLVDGDPPAMLKAATTLIGELGIVLSLSLVAMAAIDYGYCYWRYEQSLMMTVEEVRREQREENGDPHMKSRRRELAGSMRDQLPEASPVGPI
jgi:flagellar biosynthesis protein FlhB